MEAIRSLWGYTNGCIQPALRKAAEEQNPEMRLIAEAELLERNDVSSLNAAVKDAFDPQQPAYLRQNIIYAIRDGIKTSAAIPTLKSLLKNDDANVRIAATEALRSIASPDCIPLLLSAISDSNQDVRYTAVIGLADINNVPMMHPSIPAFRQDESKYISYWQRWGQARQ